MTETRFSRLVLLVACLASPSITTWVAAEDWPYWRGPRMNGQSAETGLPHDWDPQGGPGSNLLWKREDLGTRSSPVVFDDRLYINARHRPGTDREQEKIVCLDAKTGDTIWERPFSIYLSDVPADRVASSAPTVDTETGNVYTFGVSGLFCCLDGRSGDVLWDHSMSEEFGFLSTYGGRTCFPVVFEDLVVVSGVAVGWGDQATRSHRFLAFDKSNGQVVWSSRTRSMPYESTYSAPVLTAFDGQAAMVFGSGDGGVHAFQPRTGRQIWSLSVSRRGINTTPLVVGDRVYCGHASENLDSTEIGAFFAVDGTAIDDLTGTENELWSIPKLLVGRAAPLQIGKMLYIVDDRAKMHIISSETGEETFAVKMGTVQRSSPVVIDRYIWNIENNGRWFILINRDDRVRVVNKGRLPAGDFSDGSIAVSNGRIFIPSSGALYCVGSGQPAQMGAPIDPRSKEADKTDDDVAQVLVVPNESLFYPGVSQQYQARLFNEAGQFIRLATANELSFEFDGEGSINNSLLTIPANARNHAATITATVGSIKGSARARIVPTLEWSFDFNDGQVPDTWVGTRYRNVVVDGPLLETLHEEDPVAADAYIFLHSSLVNSGASELEFDNSSPEQNWTAFLSFFEDPEAEDAIRSLERAQEHFGQSLQRLVDEKVLGAVEWTTWNRKTPDGETVVEPRLIVTPGTHTPNDGVLCKIRTASEGSRSQCWIGHDDFSEYTIQADVYAFERHGSLPDIGVIGQRYTLDLMGQKQQLQIRTWAPQPRMAEEEPFEWQPFNWYRLKLSANMEGDEAVLRGKVWLKGEKEPDEWLVEARDVTPNAQGSPGLFGNAKTSEILVDNVIVTVPAAQIAAQQEADRINAERARLKAQYDREARERANRAADGSPSGAVPPGR